MKKRELILITYNKLNADHYTNELLSFFDHSINIKSYTITDGLPENISGDLILVLTPIAELDLKSHISANTQIIYGKKVITKEAYEKLLNVPPDTKAILMTTNKTSSFEMATYLYKIGISHIDFMPSYPENRERLDLDTAVTPGQIYCIPPYIKNIIDLGWRHISADTLMAVLVSLKLHNENFTDKIMNLSQILLNSDFQCSQLDKISVSEEMLYQIINVINDGLLFINKDHRPVFVNTAFLNILGLNPKYEHSPDLLNYLPREIREPITKNKPMPDEVFIKRNSEKNSKDFILTIKPFRLYQDIYGSFIILKEANNISNLENKIRKGLTQKLYTAKYTFDDIKGESPEIKQVIDKAKKMAMTDFPVLIMGETGTGKELFAQSIHNYSKRRNKPFVAINCAALSSALLESELFGYEGGSFTGAKKEGKAGLFEYAHTGTIFLDEIGDMPQDLQSKLLRVLQEKEIRRVGSNSTIPVDVRIIAATNKSLEEMIESNTFRMDLFYRISMFTLHIPSLFERKGDILCLANYFIASVSKEQEISRELKIKLSNMRWKGNVRELKNCIEYLSYMGGTVLVPDDLPESYKVCSDEGVLPCLYMSCKAEENFSNLHPSYIDRLPEHMQLYPLRKIHAMLSVLSSLYECSKGRNAIIKEFSGKYTEHDIKVALLDLSAHNYIKVSRGRGGSFITEAGIKLLKSIN